MSKNQDNNQNANLKYKDTVFTLLLNDKNTIIEVYNAIAETNYGPDTDVEITTLKNVLYRGRLNDLSFVLDGKLVVLIEHQSTINENITLRMLLYIAEVYNRYTRGEDLYRRKKLTIPYPEFIVLYNGIDDMPGGDKQILKLSDMFDKSEYTPKTVPTLELTVTMYNINKGRNPEIAKRSPTLDGYETFIHMSREYEKTMNLEDAIKKAVIDCINQNILKTFLLKHKQEVIKMLTMEWDFDVELMVAKKEAWEDGIEKGIEKEKKENALTMKTEGIDINTIAKITGLTIDDIIRL